MAEFEPQPKPTIQVPTLGDVPSYRRMQADSWLDTYPNEEAGVPYEWVKHRTEKWMTPEALEHSKGFVERILEDKEHQFLYVAKTGDTSVGMVNTSNIEGKQRLEALYVDKKYHGTGLAQEMLDVAMNHLDLSQPVVLEVVAYNQRAQRFYEKNGFEVQPNSEHLYENIMPSIVMIRPGGAKL